MSKLFLMSCGFVIYIDVIWMMAVLSGLSSVKERMFLWTHESLLMVCQRVFSSLSTVSMSSDESGRPVYCSVRVHHHHHGPVRVTQHVKRTLPAFPSAAALRNLWWFAEVINHFISERVWCCGRRFVLRRNVEWNSQPCSSNRTFRYHDACCFMIVLQYPRRGVLCKASSNTS